MRPYTRLLPAIGLLLLALPAAVLISLPATVGGSPALIATPTPNITPDPSVTPVPPTWPSELRSAPPFHRTWLPYAAIPFAAGPASVADPTRGRLYLAGDNVLAIYDTTPTLLAELPIHADRLFLGPDGDRLYATTPSSPDCNLAAIHVIDTEALTLTAKLPYACPHGGVPCRILDLAEGPGRRLYVAPAADRTRVDVLDGRTGDPLAAVIASTGPQPVAQLEIHDTRLYVAPANHPDTGGGGAIFVYDISDPAPVFLAALEAVTPHNGMRLSPDGNLIYLTSGFGFHVFTTEGFLLRFGRYGVLRDILPAKTLLMNTWDAAGIPAFYEYDPGVDYGLRGLDHRSPLAGDPTPGDATPYALALPGGGIATLHDHTVILRRPIDHAAALAIVTKRSSANADE